MYACELYKILNTCVTVYQYRLYVSVGILFEMLSTIFQSALKRITVATIAFVLNRRIKTENGKQQMMKMMQ